MLSRPCPGQCGYQVTWHETHCCTRCVKGNGHGDKCERKACEKEVKSPNGSIDSTTHQVSQQSSLYSVIESVLRPRSILCGSLWPGSLHSFPRYLDPKLHPQLLRLVRQVQKIPKGTMGSISRTRSPLQVD